MQVVPASGLVSGTGTLVHELYEAWETQINGTPSQKAHIEATKFEDQFTGWTSSNRNIVPILGGYEVEVEYTRDVEIEETKTDAQGKTTTVKTKKQEKKKFRVRQQNGQPLTLQPLL